MGDIKQSAVNTATFTLTVDPAAYPLLDFNFYQNGELVQTYTQDNVKISGKTVTVGMLAAEAARFSPARATVECVARAADGSGTIIADGILVTIDRSNARGTVA